MSNGINIRAQIDADTAKALILLNGAGALALLAFLPAVLGKSQYEPVARAAFVAVIMFMLELAAAVIHNHLRRRCSLHYDQHSMRPRRGRLLGLTLWAPTVCCVQQVFMWTALVLFLVAGSYVAVKGIEVLDNAPAQVSAGKSVDIPNAPELAGD